MAHTRAYEGAVAHLIQEIRVQKATTEAIRVAIAGCRRHLSMRAIEAAAMRDEDPARFIAAAMIRCVQELEQEFTTGPDDPVWQAQELLKRLAATRT